jgi:ribosome-associated heat shock protein Hsp15
VLKVRIDKWLWAARFYKTRARAKSSLETGKVKMDGQKCKPSRSIEIGDSILIKQGDIDRTIIVMGLSEQRRGAPEAQKLYQETENSFQQRQKKSAERKALFDSTPVSVRPTKKQRRQIHRFLEK